MKKLFAELIRNESGLILSAEMVLVLTIAVLGVIVGLVNVQTAVVTEFQDLALAFGGLNQSYMTPTFMGCRKWFGPTSWTSGSGFIDFYDACVGSGPWGGTGAMGGGFGGGYGGMGGGGYGGMSGGYSEIGGNGYISSQAPLSAPCETCTPGSNTTTSTIPDQTTTLQPTPSPLPPPSVPTRDSL